MHDLIVFKDAVICDLITVGCDLITSSTAVVLQARSRRLLLTLNFRTVILPSATAVVLNSRAICTHATRRGHWAVCQHISRRRLTGLARHLRAFVLLGFTRRSTLTTALCFNHMFLCLFHASEECHGSRGLALLCFCSYRGPPVLLTETE